MLVSAVELRYEMQAQKSALFFKTKRSAILNIFEFKRTTLNACITIILLASSSAFGSMVTCVCHGFGPPDLFIDYFEGYAYPYECEGPSTTRCECDMAESRARSRCSSRGGHCTKYSKCFPTPGPYENFDREM
ncbi:MAG: hypothetical protein NT027_16675 [Proteobacteria bacterium]|nr:hypothetical protein [Pseudomonadota bacterium]